MVLNARAFTHVALVATLVFGAACVPSAQKQQAAVLLQQLAAGRAGLLYDPTDLQNDCKDWPDVRNRLVGEPGMTDIAPAWQELMSATDAFVAACGQLRLASTPAADTDAVREAQARWRSGADRELSLMCTHLQAAAAALRVDPGC